MSCFPLQGRRQLGAVEPSKCLHLVSAFLDDIWHLVMRDRYGNWVFSRRVFTISWIKLIGKTVQAIEDSVWEYISLRLQRTWAKIKSSILEIQHELKPGTLGEKVKTPAESQDDSRHTVLQEHDCTR